MSLSIQDDLIERKEIVGGKEKVHVLQCLSLHCVLVNKFSYFDVQGKGKSEGRYLQARNSPYCLAMEEVSL